MPDVELRADWDRDGRLSWSPSEYDARDRGAGAILAVNVDHDGRALPATPRADGAVVLDHERPTKDGRDGDLLPLTVVVSPGAHAAYASLALRISGENADAVGMVDAHARVQRPARARSDEVEFALPAEAGRHAFRLEARRVAGSPLGRAGGLLTVRVVGTDAAGRETTVDQGRLQLARFLVMDDVSTARHLYICSLLDNAPTVADVRDAMAGLSPPADLRVVSPAESRGDGWLQDQFQLGYIATPGHAMQALLHLPRLRTNAQLGPGQRNLAALVRSHFPSTDLGLVQDYWLRTVTIPHEGGATEVGFAASWEAYRIFEKVLGAEYFLRDAIDRLCAVAKQLAATPATPPCQDLPPVSEFLPVKRLQVPELLRRVEQLTARLLPDAHGQEQGLRALLGWSRAVAREVDRLLAVAGTEHEGLFDLALSARTFRMQGGELVALFDRVRQMHDSLVYGGNIEASPPLAAHPFGKVVIGESEDRPMDPALRDLFADNAGIQPVVTVDTSWLGVGHVDELIAFLPDRTTEGRSAILRASPEVAAALFTKAASLFRAGAPEHDPDAWVPWRPLTLQRHDMGKGAHPVTRMFRGKLWLHQHPPANLPPPPEEGGDAERHVGEVLAPPRIYRRLVDWHGGLLGNVLAPYYPDDEVETHYYKAALTPLEALHFGGATNDQIAEEKLGALDELLEDEFDGFRRLAVPVLFDAVDRLEVGSSVAFTPNLVNLQYVNGRVLVPDPFGPRMTPLDAAQVVRAVLLEEDLADVAELVSPAWMKKRKLDVTAVWINRDLRGDTYATPFRSALDLAREFRDGFPREKAEDELARLIRKTNPTAFDRSGDLKAGWRRIVIPEGMVDLLQAYTQAVLESLGVAPRWIDSWYYHLRYGEVHCGTNVLRTIPSLRPAWWTRLAAG